jgi:flavin reductase (DIM6/NTAB) family NADH-FMN oxidoreductase RutF
MPETDPHKQLGAALGRIPSGLFILTARCGEVETGMLTSWVQQCSFDPPLIMVAIKCGREVLDWLTPGAALTLNLLDASETDMIVHFGRGFALGEPAFKGLDIDRPEGSAPVLTEALAYLECKVKARHGGGDHEILICEVVRGRMLGDGQPMIHIRKSGFHY